VKFALAPRFNASNLSDDSEAPVKISVAADVVPLVSPKPMVPFLPNGEAWPVMPNMCVSRVPLRTTVVRPVKSLSTFEIVKLPKLAASPPAVTPKDPDPASCVIFPETVPLPTKPMTAEVFPKILEKLPVNVAFANPAVVTPPSEPSTPVPVATKKDLSDVSPVPEDRS